MGSLKTGRDGNQQWQLVELIAIHLHRGAFLLSSDESIVVVNKEPNMDHMRAS